MFSSLQAYLFRRSCKDAQPVRQPVFHGWETEGLLSQVASQWHGMLQLAPVLQQAQFTHRYASFFQERLGIPPGFQQGAVAIVEEQIRPHIVEKGKLTDIGYILRASSVIAGQLSTQSDIIIIEEPENHSLIDAEAVGLWPDGTIHNPIHPHYRQEALQTDEGDWQPAKERTEKRVLPRVKPEEFGVNRRHSKKLDKAHQWPYTSIMKNKRLLSPKEASSALGISVRTLYRWEEAGNLSTVRTVGNQRRIPIEEIARLRRRGKGQSGAERCVLYARVSSVRQEQDGTLARQTERLKEAATARGYEVGAVISEQASSLNENRKGMKKLLTLIGEQAVDVILIEYPDRLVRFGFGYLEETFRWQGVRLEVLDPPKQLEPTEELVQDLLTIVTVFADRLYGHRARGIRKRVQTALKECEEIPVEGTHGTGEPDDQTAP